MIKYEPSKLTCINCGGSYIALNNRPGRMFCTPECSATRYEVTCAKCGALFRHGDKRGRMYCSKSCSNSANPKRTKTRTLKYCLKCQVLLDYGVSMFCSVAHKSEFTTARWREGKISATRPNGSLSRWARNFLLEQAGDKCSLCGWGVPNPVVGRPILAIDHIDGNWLNNDLGNLRVLRYNCHTLTPTFGSLNRGKAVLTRQAKASL